MESRSVELTKGLISEVDGCADEAAVTAEAKGLASGDLEVGKFMPTVGLLFMTAFFDDDVEGGSVRGPETTGGMGVALPSPDATMVLPPALLSTVFTVTVVPAGMFFVSVSALLAAASDRLLAVLFLLKLFL